jgi:hypothetical protein
MKIQVKQEHINDGLRGNNSQCPIALAVGDAFPEAKLVSVRSKSIFVYHDPVGRKVFKQSEEVQKFVGEFDKGFKVYPFSFELPT